MVENKIYIFRQQAAKSSHDKDLEDLESWANAWGAQYILTNKKVHFLTKDRQNLHFLEKWKLLKAQASSRHVFSAWF